MMTGEPGFDRLLGIDINKHDKDPDFSRLLSSTSKRRIQIIKQSRKTTSLEEKIRGDTWDDIVRPSSASSRCTVETRTPQNHLQSCVSWDSNSTASDSQHTQKAHPTAFSRELPRSKSKSSQKKTRKKRPSGTQPSKSRATQPSHRAKSEATIKSIEHLRRQKEWEKKIAQEQAELSRKRAEHLHRRREQERKIRDRTMFMQRHGRTLMKMCTCLNKWHARMLRRHSFDALRKFSHRKRAQHIHLKRVLKMHAHRLVKSIWSVWRDLTHQQLLRVSYLTKILSSAKRRHLKHAYSVWVYMYMSSSSSNSKEDSPTSHDIHNFANAVQVLAVALGTVDEGGAKSKRRGSFEVLQKFGWQNLKESSMEHSKLDVAQSPCIQQLELTQTCDLQKKCTYVHVEKQEPPKQRNIVSETRKKVPKEMQKKSLEQKKTATSKTRKGASTKSLNRTESKSPGSTAPEPRNGNQRRKKSNPVKTPWRLTGKASNTPPKSSPFQTKEFQTKVMRKKDGREKTRSASENEALLCTLVRETQTSINDFNMKETAGDMKLKQKKEFVTLHVTMPSGKTETLSGISNGLKADDIMYALSVLQDQERKKAKVKSHTGSHCQKSFNVTLVHRSEKLLGNGVLKYYKLSHGRTISAFLNALGSANKPCLVDWVDGRESKKTWKHVQGSRVCTCHSGGRCKTHNRVPLTQSRWSMRGENAHGYRQSTQPPLLLSVEVVDSSNRNYFIEQAEVDLFNVTTGVVSELGDSRTIIIETSGMYRLQARLKAHTQLDHLEPFFLDPHETTIDPVGLPLPHVVEVSMLFNPVLTVHVTAPYPSAKDLAFYTDDSHESNEEESTGSSGRGLDMRIAAGGDCVELNQTRVTLQASDGSLIDLGRADKRVNRTRTGVVVLPNTFRLFATLVNYRQVTLTAPMHLERASWLTQTPPSGEMEYTVEMEFVPKFHIEILDARDGRTLLQGATIKFISFAGDDASTASEETLKPKEHRCVTLTGSAVHALMAETLPGEYALTAELPNYTQMNYLEPFELHQSSWPMDRPLKLSLRMNLEPVIDIEVTDVDSGANIHQIPGNVRILERVSGRVHRFIFTRKTKARKIAQRINCPETLQIFASFHNYEQVDESRLLHLDRTTWVTKSVPCAKVHMRYTHPLRLLFGDSITKHTTKPLLLLDIGIDDHRDEGSLVGVEMIKNVLRELLLCRYGMPLFNMVTCEREPTSWKPAMTSICDDALHRRSAMRWVDALDTCPSQQGDSHAVSAFASAECCGMGANQIFLITNNSYCDAGTQRAAQKASVELSAPINVIIFSASQGGRRQLRELSRETKGVFNEWEPSFQSKFIPPVIPEIDRSHSEIDRSHSVWSDQG